MASLSIRSVDVGAGRPKAIVSLMEPNLAGLVTKARQALAQGADVLEWRADFLARPSAAVAMAPELRRALPDAPLIFTFRSEPQGGRQTLPPEEQVSLTSSLIATGAMDVVDIELGLGDDAVRLLVGKAHARGMRAIVSHHDFSGTPPLDEMARLLGHMAELGADIPKLAVLARSPEDCLRLMTATAQVAAASPRPLLTMAMGAEGKLSRLAGEAFGSALTFCALGSTSAPGQVELRTAIATMDLLHESLAEG